MLLFLMLEQGDACSHITHTIPKPKVGLVEGLERTVGYFREDMNI